MDREMLQTTNRSLAEKSLARRPQLCNGKLQLAEKYRQLSNLATHCWDKQSQLGEFTAVCCYTGQTITERHDGEGHWVDSQNSTEF